MHPLVSVIIPSYNVQNYLHDALDSIIEQSYKNWEAIIVDDGSKDNTAEIAKEYCQKNSRFKYFYQENKGLSAARKTGIDNANGEYIQFLDADDILLPERLKEMIDEYEKISDKTILYSDYWIGLNNSVTGKKITPNRKRYIKKDIEFNDMYFYWRKSFLFVPACPLYKNKYFDDIEYDDSFKSAEDFDLYLNLQSKEYKFRFISSKNIIYRDNPQGLSNDKTFIYQCLFQVLYKWKNTTALSKKGYLLRCAKLYSEIFYNRILLKNTKIVQPISNKFSNVGKILFSINLIVLSTIFFIGKISIFFIRVIKKRISP